MPQPPRKLTFRGKTLTIDEWADEVGVPSKTIRSRLDKQGWTVAKALTKPADMRFSGRRKKTPVDVPRTVPPMREHSSGQARAAWWAAGRQHQRYFGVWGSKAAAAEYRRFVAEWAAGSAENPADGEGVTVAKLVTQFIKWAAGHYRKNGKVTSHYHSFKSALNPLLRLYAGQPVAGFEAEHLRAYVAHLVAEGYGLVTVNRYQWCVVNVFDWGVTRKLTPAGVVHVLERVEKQVPGRSAAPESAPKKAVPVDHIEKTLPHLHPRPDARAVYESMVRLQLANGIRPGELCGMRVKDVETNHGDLWRYEPRELQKNRHRRKRRVIWFGPRSQAMLTPVLAGLSPDDFVFGYVRRGVRKGVTVGMYANVVGKACKAAGVPHWHPHLLRHNRATEVQRRYEDDEAVRIAIGDTPEVARQIYVDDPAEAAAKRIARETT